MSPFELTLFSLNLRFGRADDGPNGWLSRKQFLPLLLNRYPADFYAFQEVNDFQARDLEGMLTDYHFIGERRSAPDYWQNNLIFYHRNWQCSEQQHFYLSQTPDIPSKFDDSKWPRQCTMGIFQQGSRRILCVNTHFDFAEKVQEKSARLILSRLSTVTKTDPAVIMGDFNASPDSRCYQTFTGKMAEKRFKNAFQPPFLSTHHGFTGKTDSGAIDWILYRGPIVPDKSKILRDNFNGQYPSDHFPLLVRFHWMDERSEMGHGLDADT